MFCENIEIYISIYGINQIYLDIKGDIMILFDSIL